MSNQEITTFQVPAEIGDMELRVVNVAGEPWLVATDVAKALGYSETHAMLRSVADDQKGRQSLPTLGGTQAVAVISESGFYKVALRAQDFRPGVAAFQEWVTRDVLPSIRKHGGYIVGQENMNQDELVLAAMTYLQSKVAEQAAQIAVQQAIIEVNVEYATVQKWAAMIGMYRTRSAQQKLGYRAKVISKAAGITLEREARQWKGETCYVNIYPVAILKQAVAYLIGAH